MLRSQRVFSTSRRKDFRLAALTAAAIAPALVMAGTGASAANPERTGPVVQMFTIPVPVASTNKSGGMYGFDISFVDQASQTYYLGDRSNAAVDVVNASTGAFVKQITAKPAFAGVVLTPTGSVNNNLSGPNGVATGGGCLFAGDGPSRVVSFDIPGGAQASSISTGGKFRADEMAYDPKDRLLAVANNADAPPFVTLLNVSTKCVLTIKSKTPLDAAHGVDATNGAEQPVWDPGTQRFYMSVPQVGMTEQFGAIARINTKGVVETTISIPFCQPAGLALGPNQTLLAGCSVVFDTAGSPWFGADTNTATPYQVITTTSGGFQFVPGIGSSDEVWYNSGDNHWYTGSQNTPYSPHPVASKTGALSATDEGAGLLGAIDGTSQSLDQIVPTIDVPLVKPALGPPPGHPSGSSHSVAANATNNWVFVPLPANNVIDNCLTGCIGVYGRQDIDKTGAGD